MADALNRRIHDQITEQRTRTGRDTTTVTAARGHQVAVGDLILTRLNDATIEVRDRADVTQRLPEAPVRNGQRWQVLKVDDTPDHPRIAARRLGDGAVAVLEGDYLNKQVSSATRSPCTRPKGSPPTAVTPSSVTPPPATWPTWR